MHRWIQGERRAANDGPNLYTGSQSVVNIVSPTHGSAKLLRLVMALLAFGI